MHQTSELDGKRWIFSLMDSIPHVNFVTILVTLWAIWHTRREALHEHVFQSPYATHHFTKAICFILLRASPPKQCRLGALDPSPF